MRSGIFIITPGFLQDEILVSYNLTKEQVAKRLGKNIKGGIREWVLTVPEQSEKDNGFVYTNDEKNLCWISLPNWDASWRQLEVLLHECVHLMQFYVRRKELDCDETEAYLVEHFFHTLRKKLPDHTALTRRKKSP